MPTSDKTSDSEPGQINGNGVQDANESSLAGIAVIVEVQGQQHALITDTQ